MELAEEQKDTIMHLTQDLRCRFSGKPAKSFPLLLTQLRDLVGRYYFSSGAMMVFDVHDNLIQPNQGENDTYHVTVPVRSFLLLLVRA